MKNFTLLLIFILISAWVNAEDNPLVKEPERGKPEIEKMLKYVEIKDSFSVTKATSQKSYEGSFLEVKSIAETGKIKSTDKDEKTLIPHRFRNSYSSEDVYEVFDSMLVYTDGVLSHKFENIFNERYNETNLIQYLWDGNGWMKSKEEISEYDERGNFLSYSDLTFYPYTGSIVHEYEYDANDNMITYTQSYDGEYAIKHTFTYDERGNNTSTYEYRYESGNWIPTSRMLGEYDDWNRPVVIEGYYYSESDESWLGEAKQEIVEYFVGDLIADIYIHDWDFETNDWVYSERQVTEYFKSDGSHSKFYWYYWNSDAGNWYGNSIYNSTYSEYYYDDQDRIILEETYVIGRTDGSLTLSNFNAYDYEIVENGCTKTSKNSYSVNSQGIETRNSYWIYTESPYGHTLYQREGVVRSGTEIDEYEEIYEYDEDWNLVKVERKEEYDRYVNMYTYDESGLIRLETFWGDPNGTELTPTFYTEYTNENGMRTGEFYSYYDQEIEDFIKTSGAEDIYDFEADPYSLVVPLSYDAFYKLTGGIAYQPSADGSEWVKYQEKVYYWSKTEEPEEPEGIEVNKEDTVSVYPNPASDYIYVKGNIDNITIINVNGQIVLESTESRVDISHLPEGIYFIKAETNNVNVQKKVIIRR